jgi:hypothetical protein
MDQRLKNQIAPFVPQWLCGRESIMQNKANLPDTEMGANSCLTNDCGNASRFQAPEKQTQSNPIPPPPGSVRQTISLGSATRPVVFDFGLEAAMRLGYDFR